MSAASREQLSADSGSAAQDADPQPTTSDESSPEQETAEELPLDQVFEILKNQRRREVLQYLRDHEDEVTLGEVAEHIAAIENDTTVDAISSSERKRVYVGLYQCHLPKMDDMNIVSFNQNRGRIALAENAAQLEPFVDQEPAPSRAWYRYYSGVALVAGALFAGSQFLGTIPGLTASSILAGLVVGVALCAAVHNYATSETDE